VLFRSLAGFSIELAIEPGKGSDFQIILPISPD